MKKTHLPLFFVGVMLGFIMTTTALSIALPSFAKAQTINDDIYPKLQIDLPGTGFKEIQKGCSGDTKGCKLITEGNQRVLLIYWIALYIEGIYKFGLYIGSILAVAMIMVGGFVWLTAAGSAGMVDVGKKYIMGAISGIVILLGSYVILQTINPALVKLNPIKVTLPKSVVMKGESCEELFRKFNMGDKPAISFNPDPRAASAICGTQATITILDTTVAQTFNTDTCFYQELGCKGNPGKCVVYDEEKPQMKCIDCALIKTCEDYEATAAFCLQDPCEKHLSCQIIEENSPIGEPLAEGDHSFCIKK